MFGACEQADTHTTTHTKLLVEYSSEKHLEAKLSNEFVFNICSESSNQGASVKKHLQICCCRLLTIQKAIQQWKINSYQLRQGTEASGTSSRLCHAERLPSGLHTNDAFVAIWAPIRSGPSLPHLMCLTRVKLAVICSARSDLRRSARSSFERRYKLTHCVRQNY